MTQKQTYYSIAIDLQDFYSLDSLCDDNGNIDDRRVRSILLRALKQEAFDYELTEMYQEDLPAERPKTRYTLDLSPDWTLSREELGFDEDHPNGDPKKIRTVIKNALDSDDCRVFIGVYNG